jgi:hypothetical protein
MAQIIRSIPPIISPPYPKGGGGSTTPSGNSPGTGVQAASINIPTSNGGVFAQQQIALFPCFNTISNRNEFHSFDPTQGFNDPVASSEYHWRVEQIAPYRQATVRRIILTYRDMGQVVATFTVTGSNDAQQVVSTSTPVGFGNKIPTGRLMTVPVNLLLTALNPQVSVFREKNEGPLSIVQIVVVGEVEENSL